MTSKIVTFPFKASLSNSQVDKKARDLWGANAEVLDYGPSVSPDFQIARIRIKATDIESSNEFEESYTYIYEVAVTRTYHVTVISPDEGLASDMTQELSAEIDGTEAFDMDQEDWDLWKSSDPSTGVAYKRWKEKVSA